MIDVNELCRKAVLTDTLDDLDAAVYACGFCAPNFPLPSMIGEVLHLWDGLVFEIHVEDIDPRFEMRLWFGISKLDGVLHEYTSEDLPLRR